MIIDFHTHIGKDFSGNNEKLSFEELKKSMDKWNIDKSVVFPFNNNDEDLIKESLKILKESKKQEWIIPFLRFNPKTITEDELNELLDKGFKGIKLHPSSQNFEADSEDFFWIYELAESKGIPILFHSTIKNNNSHPKKVLEIVKKFPKLKVILAHFFGNDFEIMKEAKKYPNLYVDSSINSGTLKRREALKKHGFNRLLFASDIPYDSQGVALLKIKDAGFNKKDEKLILSLNAREVLRI